MVSVQNSGSQAGGSSSLKKCHKKRKKPGGGKKMTLNENLASRTPWTDASLALSQILKGKASGNKSALWLRAKVQNELFHLGKFIQRHPGKILFVGFLVLSALCVGLKSAKMENRVEKLWVEEGGRLQKELEFVEKTLGKGAGSMSELVIQTPLDDNGSVLTSDALLFHLDVLKKASSVSVEREDVTWRFKDLCHALTIPTSENHVINEILSNLFPCAVITPLDCFWEGSKLLASDHPVHVPLGGDEHGSKALSWTSLNPLLFLRKISSAYQSHYFESFEEFMRNGGITTGYQEKPCLDPYDPECPSTAPNKKSKEKPDIGAELTGGCNGFAARYMHWPEPLVVGGVQKNKSGNITRAKGLQSVVQLMGEKDLYEWWSDTYKVHALDWSTEMAADILLEWQTKFSQRVRELVSGKKYKMNAFSTSHLEEIINRFSEFSPYKVVVGYVFMILYTGITLFRCGNALKSLAGLGLGGVLLVTFTVAGGLGLSALLGIPYNAYTTQIIPFLALGLGVDSIFLLAYNYGESLESSEDIPYEDHIGEVLSRAGMSVLLTVACNVAAFVSAAVIPVPALRSFAFQAAILITCNLLSSLVLFPALMAWDLKRVSSEMSDVLCCYPVQDPEKCAHDSKEGSMKYIALFDKWTLKHFAGKYYGYWITKTPVKILVILTTIILSSGGLIGLARMEDGLNLTEVVPTNTSIHEFLQSQSKYFGFYNMFAVTKGNFDYPKNQRAIYDYHNSFVRVPAILKDDDGGLPEFWLSLFRNWLVRMQSAYDRDVDRGSINENKWFPHNASDDGILGFKLLVQTGHVDFPIDMNLLTRNRLVDIHGMINPSAFYNYLTAWVSNDATAYSFSQANFVPSPKIWIHDPRDSDYLIPKSQPIVYAQIPFYLSNLGGSDTSLIVQTVTQIRDICSKFEENRSLPNFPSGVPFTYWEQYLSLRFWLAVSLGVVMAGTFAAVTLVFASPWLGVIVVVVLTTVLVQLIGAMGLIFEIRFSAVPAVILILAIGIGVEFTLHVCIGFVTSVGSKNRRIILSLKHMFTPVLHGAVSTFLGIIMLAFSHFDFVFRYFFLLLSALLLLGLFNGLVFLPVLLLLMGPPGQVIPHDESDYLNSSSPEPLRSSSSYNKNHNGSCGSGSSGKGLQVRLNNNMGSSLKKNNSRKAHHHQSDLSLSTIAEESYTSQSEDSKDHQPYNQPQQSVGGTSVFVEPHVIVETTTYPASNGSHSGGSSRSSTPTSQITKVTATAKFKVEVHTPSSELIAAPSGGSGKPRRKRRGSTDGTSSKQQTGLERSNSANSSLSDSLRSSINSNGSSQDGDLGFSER